MPPPRISEEITIRKLEILLAYLAAGNLAATAEKLCCRQSAKPHDPRVPA